MQSPTLSSTLGPELSSALEQKGYTALTSIQTAVLDPALSGRDLRITSQTGSGKTVAVGFALRALVADKALPADADGKERSKGAALARPRALVVTPTRELAKQVEEELRWLFAPLDAGVISVTGGASYRDERRALSGRPAVVVGTPGRLLEHLRSGAVDTATVGAVVLDEADRLLDLGFREDLEAILAFAPQGHRTHLVSATFPREVRALADATQDDPVHVEGTRLGAANVDIDHVVHLIEPRGRVDAIVNLLLANQDEQTLVFARTRAEVASIARELKDCGFAATSLSGEMDQTARNRALAAFKRGDLRVLVATDVAARGIDVQDIARVIHAEPPTDADSYTHRSGRTGRAGRKGTSSILAVIPELARTTYLLQRAGVAHRFEPIPTAATIRAGADERMVAHLTAEDAETGGFDDRIWSLAKRIAAAGDVTRALARLLVKTRYAGPTEPRDVRVVELPSSRGKPAFGRGAAGVRDWTSRARRPDAPAGRARADDAPRHVPREAAHATEREAPREVGRHAPRNGAAHAARPPASHAASRPRDPAGRAPRDAPRAAPKDRGTSWVPFHVTWGEEQGADARRLLAMACRRGNIRGTDVGSIRVARSHSVMDVASHVADAFAKAVGSPDTREPHIVFRPDRPERGDHDKRPAAYPDRASGHGKPPSPDAKPAPRRRLASEARAKSLPTPGKTSHAGSASRARARPDGDRPLKQRSRER